MSKILVTGGAGFIGSHTVVELVNAGYQPIILDNFANSEKGIIKQIEKITGVPVEFHEIDLCDKEKLQEFVNKNPDINKVIHFAAYKSVGESVAEPLKYYENNFGSLLNLLDAYKNKKVDIVFSSSCCVYGKVEKLPVTENTPIQKAECPYGNTKKIAEEILTDITNTNKNYRVIALRYFNPVGAHPSGLIGELPKGTPQNILPFIMQSGIGKIGPLTIFGNDYNTPDGTGVRDYIHVVDVAKAHIAAIKKLEEGGGKNYDVFNISVGKGTSVLELIQMFEKVSGVKLNYNVGPRRPGDIEIIWADVAKANKELNWKADIGIEEMLSSAWKWEKYIKENPIS
jgi:UDP-glucose 4-epimerase